MDQKRFSPKIINDPVYGFVTIQHPLIYQLLEHPSFQRLRHIKQLGLSYLVYPGANHTRFHHALGAMHLMQESIRTLRMKGVEIAPEEEVAVLAAILLHDIGHGPFSHALEHVLIEGVSHEHLSSLLMDSLNIQFGGKLDLAISIFTKKYHKVFLSQLISGQLDIDRMDYLNRDSFFTGVSEGVISSDRIIKMLTVHNGQLVVEEKGIYSVEKFIVARRLMYWQVYLHKTVVAAEFMLIHALRRAKELVKAGAPLFASPSLHFFLSQDIKSEHFEQDPMVLTHFARLDDYDIWGAIKVWQFAPDYILATLCSGLVNRQLFKIEISKTPFSAERIAAVEQRIREEHQLPEQDLPYFIYSDRLTNKAYNEQKQNINLLLKNGSILDLSKASDNLNISALSTPVEKYFLCYPR